MGNTGCKNTNDATFATDVKEIVKKNKRFLKKIMVVDDVKIMGDIISEYFKIANKQVQVLYAQNGLEAIQLVKEHLDIDIVWMDIVMQPLNGYDTTKELLQINPSLHVIGLTGMVDEISRQQCREVGMQVVCIKPVHFETLVNIVEQLNYEL